MTLRRSAKTLTSYEAFFFFFWRRKLVYLHLVPRLPVWECVSRTKDRSRSVEEKSGVYLKKKKKSQMYLRVPSQKLLWHRMLTSRYSECVVVCVFRDTFTFWRGFEGSYQNLSLSSSPAPTLSSPLQVVSPPVFSLSSLAYSCPHLLHPYLRKNTHMLHCCPHPITHKNRVNNVCIFSLPPFSLLTHLRR